MYALSDQSPLVYDLRNQPPTLGGILTRIVEGQTRSGLESSTLYIDVTGHIDEETLRVWEGIAGLQASKVVIRKFPAQTYIDSREVEPAYSLRTLSELWLADSGNRFFLKWKEEEVRDVRETLAQLGSPVITVHFRNQDNIENRILESFRQAILEVADSPDFRGAKFVLVGEKPTGTSWDASWFTSSDEIGWGLPQELIASQVADCFIGVASGFCSAAIFSNSPYLIYKDPEHHRQHVSRDIGPDGGIVFAAPEQKLFRQFPDSSHMLEALRDSLRLNVSHPE